MTKKNILWISLVYFIYAVSLFLVTETCHRSWCNIHDDDVLGVILFIFFPLLAVFLFSLITYRMKDEVFQVWRNFSYWFIPLTMFLTLITPDSNSVIMSWGKEVPAMGMTILYVFISTIIILRTWLRVRKEQ